MTYQAIRKQIHLIPELVKAALLDQALDVQMVIATTFQPSDAFKATTRNLPMNHLELINQTYCSLAYTAFEAGVRYAKNKYEASPFSPADAILIVPIPQVFSDDLVTRFKDQTKQLLASFPNEEAIYAQLRADVGEAFHQGAAEGALVSEQARVAAEQAPSPLTQTIEKEEGVKVDLAEPKTEEPIATASTDTKSLDDYCKLIGTPEAEKVLRYYLGLGEKALPVAPVPSQAVPAVATASAYPLEVEKPFEEKKADDKEKEKADKEREKNKKKDDKEIGKVGPFFIDPLKEVIKELCIEMSTKVDQDLYTTVTDGKDDFFIIDEIIPNLDTLTDSELKRALCLALELEECDEVDLKELFEKGDEIAKEVNKALKLSGNALLMTLDNTYVLVFSFKPADLKKLTKDDPKEEEKAEAKTATAAGKPDDKTLAKSPMGALSVKVQAEVRALHQLTSNFLFKDLSRASPRVAEYYGAILTDIRQSKQPMKDGTRKLNAGIAAALSAVYGQDAVDFYNSL